MPKLPFLVQRGSATVRIRPYDNHGSKHFLITWNALGRRRRESRASLGAARLRAGEIATCKRRSKNAAGAGRKVRHLRAKEGGLRWEVKREGGRSLLFGGWSVAEAGEQQRCARGGMGYPAGVTGV